MEAKIIGLNILLDTEALRKFFKENEGNTREVVITIDSVEKEFTLDEFKQLLGF